MSTGLKANSDGSAAIQVGGSDAITLTSGGAAAFLTSPTTVQAGTAAAPSITFSGDTNTGIYSPGADQVAIATGGTKRFEVDAAGNAGLGVTPSAWAGGQKALQFGIGGALFGDSSTPTAQVSSNTFFDGSNYKYIASAATSRFVQVGGEFTWNNAASGTAGNTVTFSERMRLDASGNLGIGTSSPGALLHTYTSTQESVRFARNSTSSSAYVTFYANNSSSVQVQYAGILGDVASSTAGSHGGNLLFYTTGSGTSAERARITSGGEVYIAGTTDQGAYNLQCNGTGVWGAGAYVNGSDERIKEDIAPITSGLDVVTKLNPVTYRYKEDWSKDQSTQTGFIAQELLVAMEGQNYVDGVVQQGGSEGYYSVAYQNIIPLLTKAIQELKAELDATKAEVAALKGTA